MTRPALFRVPLACLLLALAAALWVSSCRPPEPPPPEGAPRLILLMVVDQCGAGYMERFRPLFTGGLRRLLDDGVVFTDARHDHAITATAVGHATISTGRYPCHHGIINNQWIDPELGAEVASVEDDDYGVSPRRLLCDTLGGWLKARSRHSMVFTASGKDRAAVLLGGHAADGAFWYDKKTGDMVTSAYYAEEDPEWLEAFNEHKFMDQRFGTVWEPLPVPEEQLAALEIEDTDLGPLHLHFPHIFGLPSLVPGKGYYASVRESPWQDRQVMELARRIIDVHDLGNDGWTDLLALSFSALDLVGHDYGPNSREVLDVLLRLDRNLGEFLDFVDERVGLSHTVAVLTADHGVVPLPEFQKERGRPGTRIDADEMACFTSVRERLREKHGRERWLLRGPFVNAEVLERHGLSREVLENEVAGALEACPSVERVWTRTELLAANLDGGPNGNRSQDPFLRLFANSFHPDRSPDFLVQFASYHMPNPGLAVTHGSPYSYDTRIPLIFLHPGAAPGSVDQRVASVDLAPTLAAFSGIVPPEGLDGTDLSPLVLGGSRVAPDAAATGSAADTTMPRDAPAEATAGAMSENLADVNE